jgi:hypothetical protein
MKTMYLLMLPIVLFFYGCTSPDQLNSSWKTSLAQLRITPVMPLRERINVGEVYRYMKRPKSYYEESQIEPPVAFTIDPNEICVYNNEKRTWPTFTYNGSQRYSLGASIKTIGLLSFLIDNSDNISIKVVDGYSNRADLVDILMTFIQQNEDGWQIVEKYSEKIRKLGNLRYRLGIGKLIRYVWEDKDIVYLRIPAEIYYANGIQVSISKTGKIDGGLKLDEERLKDENIKVVINNDTNIVLIETFKKPMAIGYRGLLFKVHTQTGQIEENIEDLN